MHCFRLCTFNFKWEPECCVAKLTQSATSTATTCPVAALLFVLNTGKDRSLVPVALGIYNCRALTKKPGDCHTALIIISHCIQGWERRM